MSHSHPALQVSPETASALDVVANHDIKAPAYAVLADSNQPLTSTGLANRLSTLSDVPVRMASGYPLTFKDHGFATTEAIGWHRGAPRMGYIAINTSHALPAVGAMMEFSETHDVPMMTALSFTASKGSRAPVNSVQILDALLHGVKSINDIQDSRYKLNKADGSKTEYNTRLKTMIEDGLVVAEDFDPAFTIETPQYTGLTPFENLAAPQQNVYTLLQFAEELQPHAEWTLSELQNLAVDLGLVRANNPEELVDFRSRLTRVISKANPRYSPGATQKVDVGHSRYTYKIAPHFERAAADLVERVIALDTSEKARKAFAETALDYIKNRATLASIVTRGVKTSPFINGASKKHKK